MILPILMGYVSCYCACCAGPVSHGYGWQGALEEFEEQQTKDSFSASLQSLAWLDELRVLHNDEDDNANKESDDGDHHLSPILNYEDYGIASDEARDRHWSLNPIAWELSQDGDDMGSPGIAIHAACWPILKAALQARGVSPKKFVATYRAAIGHQYEQYEASSDQPEEQTQQFGPHGGALLDALLPQVDYGEGVLFKVTQFYELEAGKEWLLAAPTTLASTNDAAKRNRNRIAHATEQIVDVIMAFSEGDDEN